MTLQQKTFLKYFFMETLLLWKFSLTVFAHANAYENVVCRMASIFPSLDVLMQYSHRDLGHHWLSLLPAINKPLPEPMLVYYQWGSVTFADNDLWIRFEYSTFKLVAHFLGVNELRTIYHLAITDTEINVNIGFTFRQDHMNGRGIKTEDCTLRI